MADSSDVEQTLADSVTTILYPHGLAASSLVGVPCRVYRGWPNPAGLNADLSAGIVNITISPNNDVGEITTRYLSEWQVKPAVPSLTATVNGKAIFVGGVAVVGDIIGVLVDGSAYAYRVVDGDTPNSVAANLCTAIQAGCIAALSGSNIDIQSATTISARVVCDKNAFREFRRQRRGFHVICWCATPAIRDTIASTIDLGIAQFSFLTLPDDTFGRVEARSTSTFDQSQNALLYRRDLVYDIEYPTVLSVNLPSMLFGAAAINGQISFG